MRTIVDLPDEQIEQLEVICSEEKVSRSELIRLAISKFLQAKKTKKDPFGLWKNKKTDGVKYQRELRGEWDESSI